jgi:Putative beta-barrel porin-2, OmpL-like. bbp2
MRSAFRSLVAAAASFVLVATGAAAEDASSPELQQMRDTMLKMQDQIHAQQAELDAQRKQLEGAGLADDSSARSKLSSFLESVEFSGWVAASYTINSRNKGNNGLRGMNNGIGFDGNQNGPLTPVTEPLHADSNTFSVDQLWFRMDKAPTEESRAGFHTDLVLGKTAELLNGTRGPGFGGDFIEMFTGYVSYLAPVGNGIRLDLGKTATAIGAEVVPTTENWFVTRGIVWSLQPVTHTGIMASAPVGGGFTLLGGYLNDAYSDTIADFNKGKTLHGGLTWANDMVSAGANVMWGTTTAGNEKFKSGIADLVVKVTPMDRFSMWVNYDYHWNQGQGAAQFTSAHAVAAAARFQVLERTGVAIRWEGVFEDHGNTTSTPAGLSSALGLGGHGRLYSLTGTIDHMLTDNLMIRGEARYDWANIFNRTPDRFFQNGSGGPPTRDDQGVFMVEAVYTF